MKPRHHRPSGPSLMRSCLFACLVWLAPQAIGAESATDTTTVFADVVALDQPFMFNRLGAAQPSGMIFALKGDVVSNSDTDKALQAGAVMLRPSKRPRPITLRVNLGQYLEVKFTN